MASGPKPFLLLSIRTEERAALEEHAAFARFLGVAADELTRSSSAPRRCRRRPGRLGRDHPRRWCVQRVGPRGPQVRGPVPGRARPRAAAGRRGRSRLPVPRRLLRHRQHRPAPGRGRRPELPGAGRPGQRRADRRGPGGPAVRRPAALVPRLRRPQGGDQPVSPTTPSSLATSEAAPVQAFRVGKNVYATQFHPELDLDGILTRIAVYAHYGYFDPSEQEALGAAAAAVTVIHPMTILRNFAARCRQVGGAIQS